MVHVGRVSWLKKSLGLFVSISLLLSACTGSKGTTPTATTPAPGGSSSQATQPAPPSGPQKGGVMKLVEVAPGGPFGVPWEIVGVAITSAIPALETLLFVDAQGTVHPKLAEKHEVAPDQKSLTLSLRKGVKFHDGTDFNAEAVKFNLDKQIETKRISALVQKVDVVDSHTVKLSFAKFDNRIFMQLGGTNSVQISPTSFQKKGIEASRFHPVGTGPFEFVSYDRDAKVTYKKFADYWDKGKPYLDGMEIHIIQDPQTQKAAMLSGQVDAVGSDSAELASELIKAGFQKLSSASGNIVLWPDSANSDSPLADVRVRQAVSLAIDREALVKARGFGILEPAYQNAFPGQPSFRNEIKPMAQDLAKAKELLKEAGFPNGFKTKIISPPFVEKETAVAIQGFLAQVGIQAEVELPDQAKYKEQQTKGWRGLVMQPMGFFGNYNQVMGFYFWGPEGFVSVKRPPDLQKMWDESRATTKEDVAKEQSINKLLSDDLTIIPIYKLSRTYALSKKVNGTTHMKWASWPWWTPADAWLSK